MNNDNKCILLEDCFSKRNTRSSLDGCLHAAYLIEEFYLLIRRSLHFTFHLALQSALVFQELLQKVVAHPAFLYELSVRSCVKQYRQKSDVSASLRLQLKWPVTSFVPGCVFCATSYHRE